MCFSGEASFVVGGALLPAGAFCIGAALKKQSPSYLGLAIVPLLFGIQQISEGFVWLALERNPNVQPRAESLVFLFFALAFWPFWFPVLTAMMEPQPPRRWILAGIALLATAWFWVLYYPLLIDDDALTTRVEHHSIQYDYYSLPIYGQLEDWLKPAPAPVLRLPLQFLYLASIAAPMLLSSNTWGRIPGLILALSALFSAIVFHYAFVSVWCFFAAVLAGYLCWVFYQLEHPAEPAPAS